MSNKYRTMQWQSVKPKRYRNIQNKLNATALPNFNQTLNAACTNFVQHNKCDSTKIADLQNTTTFHSENQNHPVIFQKQLRRSRQGEQWNIYTIEPSRPKSPTSPAPITKCELATMQTKAQRSSSGVNAKMKEKNMNCLKINTNGIHILQNGMPNKLSIVKGSTRNKKATTFSHKKSKLYAITPTLNNISNKFEHGASVTQTILLKKENRSDDIKKQQIKELEICSLDLKVKIEDLEMENKILEMENEKIKNTPISSESVNKMQKISMECEENYMNFSNLSKECLERIQKIERIKSGYKDICEEKEKLAKESAEEVSRQKIKLRLLQEGLTKRNEEFKTVQKKNKQLVN